MQPAVGCNNGTWNVWDIFKNPKEYRIESQKKNGSMITQLQQTQEEFAKFNHRLNDFNTQYLATLAAERTGSGLKKKAAFPSKS